MARKLLTIAGNPKLDKGADLGVWAAALHLAPWKLSGFNTCAAAGECVKACLNLAGRGGIAEGGLLSADDVLNGKRTNAVQAARIARTKWLFRDREAFMSQLAKEIQAHVDRCGREGKKPAIRLNATSDLRWESMRAKSLGGRSIIEAFPDVQFYDYTKLPNRKNVPANYHLTFSLAENNLFHAIQALENGFNVAAVFRSADVRKAWQAVGFTGAHGKRFEVIDGDAHDFRFMDPKGVVVGLYAKGPAKRDTSGFVIDAPESVRAAA